ncbi:aquaporin-like protein [Mycena rebaudengoi]|nr:aquaporin-like protein [Mycena rebaudengoi]
MVATSYGNRDGVVYLSDLHKRPAILQSWERIRHGKLHWLPECFAEALGVFFYVYCGVSSQAVWVIGNILKEPGLSSLMQIGLAYAIGILLAVGICGATSGSHFNPAITVVQMLFNGFPPLKGLRYIVAQLLGGYIACLLIYFQYREQLLAIQAAMPPAVLAGIQFTPNGPAGIFGLYLLPGSKLGNVFVNEFVADFILAMVIFGATDPSNVLIPPATAPFIIALAYAAAIWGFSAVGLSANTARDVPGRLAAMTIWGRGAVGNYKAYPAIAALTNIPATILAFIVYQIMLVDSDRVVPEANREFHDVHALHRRTGPSAIAAADGTSSSSTQEKENVRTVERV